MQHKWIINSLVLLTLWFAPAVHAANSPSPQVAVVTKLYRDFAFEAIINQPLPESAVLSDQPKKILLRYFTAKLAQSILKDRSCIAKSHEICRLDFMPLWGNQDPIGSSIEILPVDNANKVKVKVQHGTNTTMLTYHMSKTKAGWRVADIRYENVPKSLFEILEGK